MAEKRTIWICDLIGRGPGGHILQGRQFEDFIIRGPAVVYAPNSTFIECVFNFEDTIESILWEIPPDRGVLVGAVMLQECTFTRCDFEAIGFLGSAGFIQRMRVNIAPPP